jgi:hypothetical protein
MINRNKILFITIGIIFFVVVAFVIILSLGDRTPREDALIEVPNLPQKLWDREITTKQDEGGETVIENEFDGYQITVTPEWSYDSKAGAIEGLWVVYEGNGESLLSLGIMFFDNSDDTPLLTWMGGFGKRMGLFSGDEITTETEVAGRASYRLETKLYAEGPNEAGEIVDSPIENSSVVQYVVPGNERIYMISCIAEGSNLRELIMLCEERAQTFKIIN